jgi:hypothetical protein
MNEPTIGSVEVNIVVDLAEASRKVERAVELNRLIKENTEELNKLKEDIRGLAKTGAFPRTETGAVEIRAEESGLCATVSFPKDTPAIVKGADVTQLAALTQGQFDLMFKRVVVMQPTADFEKAFAASPKKVQTIVKRVVCWTANTPSVNLSK